jgi:r-opsin
MTTVSLWFVAWTPYLTIAWMGILTNGDNLTPLATIWGSVFAKASACYNPIVYGISHPKYRQALLTKFPSVACASEPTSSGDDSKSEMSVTTEAVEAPVSGKGQTTET